MISANPEDRITGKEITWHQPRRVRTLKRRDGKVA